jgi:DNA-binding NarL/FixJ family response regulator
MNECTTNERGEPIRVLIVDDHPLVREGLAARIQRESDLTVCGEAEDISHTLALVKSTHPDLVIVDLSLKSGQGLELIKRIPSCSENTKTLVCSMYNESLYAERALHAGALGYINKQEMSEKIIEAIRHVLQGKIYLSPCMTARLLQQAIGSSPQRIRSPVEALSDRELEIFKLIGQGKTARQIADELHLSVKTIDTHRENIKKKLHLRNATELSCEAIQWVTKYETSWSRAIKV